MREYPEVLRGILLVPHNTVLMDLNNVMINWVSNQLLKYSPNCRLGGGGRTSCETAGSSH